MPTYHYRCAECGEEFELWQSIHDDALTRHPGCGGTVTRVFAPAGIVLKGSGFYRTDSRAGGGKAPGDAKEKEPVKEGAGVSGNGAGGDGKPPSSKDSASSKDASSTSKLSHDGKGPKNETSKQRTAST
jgi:putative FmdB family regulatory protein